MTYALVTYARAETLRAGIVVGERLFDAAESTDTPAFSTMLGILEQWPQADAAFARLAETPPRRHARPFDESVLRAPVPRPGAIYCAGANYRDHVLEMAARMNIEPDPDPHTVGLHPWHFIKSTHSIAGPGAAVRIPPESKMCDWEVELAAVIGRPAARVPVADALRCVAGYTVANDLSARDLGPRPPLPATSPFFMDWLGHKSFDGACPLGPWIVPARDIADPQALRIRLSLNGTVMQESNTSEMIFSLAEQIAQLSLRITLHPGDVILTGTPSGVGMGRNLFLGPGDALELWCENIGTLRHTMA